MVFFYVHTKNSAGLVLPDTNVQFCRNHTCTHNDRVYFSIRKTTLRYISPFGDPQISLVINIYFLIYLESGGRFKIQLKSGFDIGFEFKFETQHTWNVNDVTGNDSSNFNLQPLRGHFR